MGYHKGAAISWASLSLLDPECTKVQVSVYSTNCKIHFCHKSALQTGGKGKERNRVRRKETDTILRKGLKGYTEQYFTSKMNRNGKLWITI
jgi:hypothetical protein